jgi:uncharacterized protein YjiS (DUF1127 family)
MAMRDDLRIDLESLDFRALSATEWTELRERLGRRAHAERAEAMRRAGAALWALPGRLVEAAAPRITSLAVRARLAARHGWRAYRAARRRRIALRQLQALDDRSLKDIGVRRSGIYAAVYRHDPGAVR